MSRVWFLHGLSVATGTKALSVRENKSSRTQALEKNPSSLCRLLMRVHVARSLKLGSTGSPLSQGCVPGASVVSGIRLDPDCLGQDGGMFDFICSSVACWQTVPAHLALVPDVWAPAIR